MKKIISLILLTFLPAIAFAWAPLLENMSTEASDVISTVNDGTYNKVIKVKLIPNDDRAKIFYYTDHIWRFDEQIEYKLWTEIIIKKDTTLNYHSVSNNYTASLIKENTYKFNYPSNLEIFYENGKISIKNNENKEIDLWYWVIWNFEIPENTIISPSDTYVYEHKLEANEKINLISPDEKIKKEFFNEIIIPKVVHREIKKEIPSNEIKTEETKIIENTETIENNWETNNSWNILKTEEATNNLELNSASKENTQVQETTNTNSLANNLKTSIIDTKKSKNNTFIVLVILFFIVWIILWILYKKEKRPV